MNITQSDSTNIHVTTTAPTSVFSTEIFILEVGSVLFNVVVGISGGIIIFTFSFIIVCVLIGYSVKRKRKKSHTFTITPTSQVHNGIQIQGMMLMLCFILCT